MDKYYIQGLRERLALKEIYSQLPTKNRYEWCHSPAEGNDKWDSILFCFNSENKLTHRFIIECKVRNNYYPTLLLEKIKYNDLKKEAKKRDLKTKKECYIDIKTTIVYINVTPKGSYWFSLKSDKINWVQELHWKKTNEKSLGKILKDVVYLDTSTARSFSLTTQDCLINEMVDVKEDMKKAHREFCLYEYIMS